jgi:hypothetical protein
MALDTPVWQRWPELVAATGALGRPALLVPTTALLEALVKHLEKSRNDKVPFEGDDNWAQRVRHVPTPWRCPSRPASRSAPTPA